MRKLISFLLLARLVRYLFGSSNRGAGQYSRRSRMDSRKSTSDTRMPETGATNNPRSQPGTEQFGQGSDKTH